MCGIAGVIVWDEKYRVTRDTLAKMSAALAHRGPDGEGLFITREHEPITPQTPQVAFAFRRLAILDCDERAMQPMHTPDGRYTIVFNGEIYNFRELREELTQFYPRYAWRTTGDTEVLLQSYATWGQTCVEKLNGMFAFAVWDHRENQLFLARDRMGQKPLYQAVISRGRSLLEAQKDLSWDGHVDSMTFASEPATLLHVSWCKSNSDVARQLEYLQYGNNAGSFYSWLFALNPGGSETILASGISHRQYFQRTVLPLPVRGERVGERASAQRSPGVGSSSSRKGPLPRPLPAYREREAATCRSLLMRAVERQLVSDVPLGLFLSGGIDSGVIAACARKFGPVQSFSIGFDDPRYNESQYAAEVARHLGTTHHVFRVTPDAAADLMHVAAAFGEPFADSSALPTYYLARETRKHVIVALSGDGGDELFGGYDRYRAIEWFIRLRFLVPSLLQRRMSQLANGSPKSPWTKLGRFGKSLRFNPHKAYASYLKIFDDEMTTELTADSDGTDGQWDRVADAYSELGGSAPPAVVAAAVDRIDYLPNDILTKVDRCSMAHGLEVRSPFMDHELVQFAAGLTTDQLLKGGPKRMLREAFADDLPAWVFQRKKMGFAVPIGEWFRGPLRAMLRDSLFARDSFARQHFQMKVVERLVEEHEAQRVDHSQRLYALLMLELWWQQQKILT